MVPDEREPRRAEEDAGAGAVEPAGRVAALLDGGLARYGKGDLLGALGEWEQALALDPTAERVLEYVRYVRENFEALDRAWQSAREVEDEASAAGVPIPEGGDEGSVEYDSIEVERPTDGWDLSDVAAPSGPNDAGDAGVHPGAPFDSLQLEVDGGFPLAADDHVPGPESGAPAALGRHRAVVTIAPRARMASLAGKQAPADEDPADAASTSARPAREQVARLEDDFPGLDGPASPEVDVPEEPKTGLIRPARVIHDDAAITAERDVEQVIVAPARASAGRQRTVSDEERERIGERITSLLEMAREFSERNDHVAAVEAAEAAAAEDPQGLVGPVLLHRHRDLLMQIYEGHIGAMTQVPLVAVPLHTISTSQLDHRAGFLLSRIDGMLTYEDILDISGMPRLDAYRLLSGLLRRGLIESR